MREIMLAVTGAICSILLVFGIALYVVYGNDWAHGKVSFRNAFLTLLLLLVTIFAAAWTLLSALLN